MSGKETGQKPSFDETFRNYDALGTACNLLGHMDSWLNTIKTRITAGMGDDDLIMLGQIMGLMGEFHRRIAVKRNEARDALYVAAGKDDEE